MDEQTLSLIPATEEDLQYLNPEPQSPELVPATEQDLQYITPEIREPTMQEMTSDFETFKMFRKAGAFDSGKTATEMVTEGLSGMASDLGHWAKTLPIRLAQNFADDKYSFNRKAKAQAKATTLQILGNLELDYKSIGAGVSRGIDKVFGDAETEEDLRSSYEFFKTQADLEKQRQGKAAEMVTEGFLGMSPEFLTLGMPEEQRELIRSQQVMPDMKAARGGTLPADPLNFVPLGAAVNVAKGTGRATLKGAEKVLINETLQLAKIKDDMTKALSRVGDNTIKSRRLAIKQAPVKARLEKGLAEVTEKIAENQAKLKPLAAKRDMALTKLASDLPVGNPLKEFLNDALKEVPIKQPLNLTNKVGGTGLVAVGKPIEYLGNALQFVKTLPQETAINMLMKAGEKAGVEVTEQQANALIKSGVIGGVGYGGYSFAGEFTDSELGKLGGAVGALLGPQFLARFGRNTAILGRETMKPASDLPFFTRLASKDAEKMTTQLIDRTALVPIESVARQVTGAAEGKILSRMGGPEAFGRMSPGGQATVNFLDRTGLGRYVESAGRMAKGVGAGGTVGGAFGLAASGGMDMPEAFYGGIGAGMLFGSAGAVGGEVARFTSPINHMEARYGDLYHYAENYLPAGQKESFNKLNRDVQMAVANKIVANPSLAIEYVSKGKDGEGGYFDRVTGDIVINVDSPRAIEPLLAHEFTHYLEQTGGKRKFIDLLIGNPMTGKPGIFVQRVTKQNKSKYPDLKVGDPIMVGEGANRKFLLSDEFETARSDYGKKLQDTLLDSDGNKMSDSDLAKIMTDEQTVSEIVAEHGTDFLLNDKRKYRDRNRGTIGKIMGGMLDTELVQNIPLLRKTLAMMGGTFRPDGQLITDNKLFSNLKRYPQITELVRKYNNQLEGMSPQKRQALETSGQIQGRDIKSGGKSTKEVVVDIKSAELAKSPQLAELLRSGTLLQIDKDGNVIPNLAMTSREQGKYNRSFAEKMKEAIEEKEANEGLPEGHVRPEVNPKTGKIRFVGRYLDDSVIDKLEQSGNWNKEQMQTLRDVNFNIRNKGGNEYLISYFKAAGQGGGKYVNAKVENHIEVPYGFEITQKNNIILRTVSVNQLVKNIDQLARQQQAELTRLYGADVAQAKIKLLQDLDKYHRNHADGQPGRTGLDANKDIAKAKADFINSAFGSGTKAEAGSNPWRASLGKKNPRDVYRSRRIERIGKMDQLSGTRFIDYDKINKAFIPAYHGTPHTFAPEPGAPLGKFRTSAIGTGEGAQAYGHGLYFAGRKGVAEHYRQKLTQVENPTKLLYDGQPYDPYNNKHYANLRLRQARGNRARAIKSLEDAIHLEKVNQRLDPQNSSPFRLKQFEETLEVIKNKQEAKSDEGSLYKVELAPKENEYLLWDKPLSEQPKGVREKVKNLLLKTEDESGFDFTYGRPSDRVETGEEVYRGLAGLNRSNNPNATTSAALKEAGIPGIKYLDGSSRNQATFKITPPSQTVSGKYMVKGDDYNSKGKHFDTKAEAEKYLQEQLDKLDYNYVIFDEADVQITDKLFMPMSKDDNLIKSLETKGHKFTGHPMLRAGQLIMDGKVVVELGTDFSGNLELAGIRALEKGAGIPALKSILNTAKENEMAVTGFAEAFGNTDPNAPKLSQERLESLYKRLGGEINSYGKVVFNKEFLKKRSVKLRGFGDKLFMPTERMGQLESGEGPVLKQVPIPTKSNIPSLKEIKSVISSEKKDKVGVNIETGTPVGIRIDIPTFERTLNNPVSKTGEPTYAISVHQSWKGGKEGRAGRVIGYTNVTHIKNPKFNIAEKGAEKIRDGKISKTTIATVEGDWIGSQIPKGLESWTQVGMNPKRHSYYYDRATGEPVIGGTEAVNVGGTVFVKDAKFGNTRDFLFMPAGDVMTAVNVRNELNNKFADLIVSGQKSIETRRSRSLDNLIGNRVKIVRTTGKGDEARVIGEVTIGEPIQYKTRAEFAKDYDKHLVDEDSDFAFQDGGKFGYPMINPERYDTPYPMPKRKGIVYTKEVGGPNKLFMPASEAGAGKGKQAEAAKLWQEKGTDSPYFKKWFGKSKVVDENGEPLVVYHGTSEKFTKFDPDMWDERGSSLVEEGIYFSENKKIAEEYMPNGEGYLMEVYLSLKKPLIVKTRKQVSFLETLDNGKEYLLKNGYDGLIYDFKGLPKEYIALKPEQIKSATGNRGTFDAGERNILFMPAEAQVQPRAVETGFSTQNVNAPKFVDKVLGGLKVDVERTKYKKPEISLADHYGKDILMTMADRTPTAHTIYGINDVEFKTPLRLGGGRDYMFDDKGSPGAVWANEKGAMSAMLNRKKDLGDKDMLVIPFEMAPTSVDFPTMAPALHIRYAQVAMKSKDKKYVSRLIRNGGGGHLTKSQDSVKVPGFDIDMNNVDKYLGKLSGPQRKTINNVFDMVNRPSPKQKKDGVKQIDGALSNFEMRAAISDPDMFNQSSLMQTNNVGLITGGKADSFHDTYNAAMQGEGLGVLKVPARFQPTMQDFLPDIFKKSTRDYVDATDAYTARMGVRTAKIDDALLKRLGY